MKEKMDYVKKENRIHIVNRTWNPRLLPKDIGAIGLI